MITIGIRSSPKAVTFAIFDTVENTVVNVEEIKVPAALSTPDALKYVRSNLLDVLREYSVSKAGIRVTEPSAQQPSVERIQIEGVIQETFASSTLQAYYVGQISSISARINIDRADFKLFVSGEKQYPVEGWSEMSAAAREAILCAIGAKDVEAF